MHVHLQCLVRNKHMLRTCCRNIDNAVRPLLTVIYGYRCTYLQLLSQMSLVSHTHAIGRKRVTWDSLHNQKWLLLCYSLHASDVVQTHLPLDGHAVQCRLLSFERAILVWLQITDESQNDDFHFCERNSRFSKNLRKIPKFCVSFS